MSASLQEQARALGDPTRHAIFRYVAEAGAPVGVAELTDHVGCNHNAVRQHLAKLVDADLVVEAISHGGRRGRPRLVYEVHPATDSRWGVPGPYERLSLLLVEKIRTGDAPVEVGRRAAGTYRQPGSAAEQVVSNIAGAMGRLGFEPKVRRRGKRIDIVLEACPFAAAAVADPDTVCSLHLGIAQGLTEGTTVAVDELVVMDPRRARCRLRLVECEGQA